MKLIKDEIAGNGKERYIFHIGRDEIRLLLGLIQSADKYTPRITETTQMLGRLNQMRKEFMHILDPSNNQTQQHIQTETVKDKENIKQQTTLIDIQASSDLLQKSCSTGNHIWEKTGEARTIMDWGCLRGEVQLCCRRCGNIKWIG